MAQTVDIAHVPALQTEIVNLFATDPNIRSTVRSRNITGKTDKWERLGGTNLDQVTTRHSPTPHTPFTHSARLCTLSDWAGSEKFDTFDQVKMIVDPKSDYREGLLRAYRVRMTRIITDALDATAISTNNDDSRTNNTFPTSQVIANGGTGFTMAKWRQANRILDNGGVPRGGRTALLSAYAVEDLLADATITSKDYSDLAALSEGTVDGKYFMGCQVSVLSDAVPDDTATLTGGTPDPILLPKAGNIRTCFIYHKSALGLSVAMEPMVRIDELPEHNYTWQVYVATALGAVRILDGGIVSIDIDESV